MSQNTNTQKENNLKAFTVMTNALGITESEFVELERQKSIERQEMDERVYPKIWRDSISDCYTSLAEACKLIDEAVSKFNRCDSVLRDTGYPISPESPVYKEWGLTILERCLKSYRK